MNGHTSWDNLVEYVDERLDAEGARAVALHLETCDRCRTQVLWLRETIRLMEDETFVAPPASARAAAIAAFDERKATRGASPHAGHPPARGGRSPWYLSPTVPWGLMAAAAILLIAIFVWRGEPNAYVASVQGIEGTVQVGGDRRDSRSATSELALTVGDFITTGMDSQVTIVLASGAATATLYENSNLRIDRGSSLQLPGLYTDTAGRIELDVRGPDEVSLDIPHGTISSRGGRFIVYYLHGDPAHGIELESLSGTVRFTPTAGPPVELVGAECLVLYPVGAPLPCETAPFPPPVSPTPLPTATAQPAAAPLPTVSPLPTVALPATLPEPAEEPAGEEELSFTGIIQSAPANGIGEWLIGGQRFVTSGESRLRDDKGPLAPGSCAEVDYTGAGVALEIRTRDLDKCSGSD